MKRECGFAAHRESLYVPNTTRRMYAEYDEMSKRRDYVVVVPAEEGSIINGYDLLIDECDARRYSLVSGYSDNPMWIDLRR